MLFTKEELKSEMAIFSFLFSALMVPFYGFAWYDGFIQRIFGELRIGEEVIILGIVILLLIPLFFLVTGWIWYLFKNPTPVCKLEDAKIMSANGDNYRISDAELKLRAATQAMMWAVCLIENRPRQKGDGDLGEARRLLQQALTVIADEPMSRQGCVAYDEYTQRELAAAIRESLKNPDRKRFGKPIKMED